MYNLMISLCHATKIVQIKKKKNNGIFYFFKTFTETIGDKAIVQLRWSTLLNYILFLS